MARFCIYADGTTVPQQSSEECAVENNGYSLTDSFDLPDTEVTVSGNVMWLNIAIIALLIVPWLWEKISGRK